MWAAVVVVVAAGCRGGWPGGAPVHSDDTSCSPTRLRLAAGPDISPTTGMNPWTIRITNTGARCVLDGYPTIRFADPSGASIPLRVTRSGDQMVTARRARPVTVTHGGSAWVVLNKYRCDLGGRTAVRVLVVRLQGAGRIGAMPIDDAGWSYCGLGDPGSTVHVSPFEPRLAAALRHD